RLYAGCESYLFHLRTTEDAGWAEQQDQDQQGEGHHVLVLVAEDVGAEGFGHAQHQAAEHGAGDAADAAQHRGGERLDAGEEADVGVDHAVLHADQHRCDGGQGGADDEGQGDDAVGVDAQQVGHLQVFSAGTTGTSEARALDEERQAEHRDDGDGEDQDLHVGHDHAVHRAFAEYQIARHQVGNGFVLGVLGQQHEVLQEDRHADRRDQRNQPVDAAQGAIGYPFDAVAVGAGDDHRSGEGADHQDRQCIEPHHRQADDHDEGDIRADHVHLAVGEVDHADDAVDHRVTDGDQGVGTANGQTVDQL